MLSAIECRQHAAEERKRSELSALPNIRLLHRRSAEKWESFADQLDHCCRGLAVPKEIEQELFY